MEDNDMRQMLLMELIDNMHSRLADKMFPPDVAHADEPAVVAVEPEAKTSDETSKDEPMEHDEDSDEPTDAELEEMMK